MGCGMWPFPRQAGAEPCARAELLKALSQVLGKPRSGFISTQIVPISSALAKSGYGHHSARAVGVSDQRASPLPPTTAFSLRGERSHL